MWRICIILFLVTFSNTHALAQDSTKNVDILNANILRFKKEPNAELQILSGDVRLKQGNTLFYCDSCIINNTTKVFEAFGNVHIVDDTTNIWSGYLRYLIEPKKAFLKNNVRLNDGKSDLTTNDLEYSVNDKIGVYKNGGKVVNKTSVLTSKEAIYYADLHDAYFKHDVKLVDPAYQLESDSLLYNSELGTARFIAETFIKDSAGRTIQTSEGFYNIRSGSSNFTKRTTIVDGATRIVGNEIASDDSTGIVQILGNGVLIDSAQGVSILANEIFADRRKEAYLATRKPLMIIKQEGDSIYVAADTLFTARLSDRFINNNINNNGHVAAQDSLQNDTTDIIDSIQGNETGEDSLKLNAPEPDSLQQPIGSVDSSAVSLNDEKPLETGAALITGRLQQNAANKNDSLLSQAVASNDSTNRYFEAFHNVRIFSDSVQAVSDSLFYSFKDSTFQLFQNPIVWSNGSQMRGDTIYLFTRNKKADRIKLFENSFIINQANAQLFNQVRSTRMDGYFTSGMIDSVRARGAAESIYFIQDEDSAFAGVNQTTSDIMDVYFKAGDLNKVVFRSSVKGTLYPMSETKINTFRLRDFEWLESRRPKTKYDLYE